MRMPMFPLGTVLLPHIPLRLHVFEERYQVMTRVVLDGDRRFGVALIEQGWEVGGGDRRFDVGTIAELVRATPVGDGRWNLLAVGTNRVRVTRWLPDDPFPLAEVEELSETPLAEDDYRLLTEASQLVRRALALKAELSEPAVPFGVELDEDPSVAAWQAIEIAPLGPLDRQRLLEIDAPADRLRKLADLVGEEISVLAHRLSGG